MFLVTEEVQEALQWLQSRIQPWALVCKKWALTCEVRQCKLKKSITASDKIDNYIEQYKAIKQPLGYTLVNIYFFFEYLYMLEIYRVIRNNCPRNIHISK